MRTGGPKNMTKLRVDFRNFVKAPNKIIMRYLPYIIPKAWHLGSEFAPTVHNSYSIINRFFWKQVILREAEEPGYLETFARARILGNIC